MSDQHFSILGMLLDHLIGSSGLYVDASIMKVLQLAFEAIPEPGSGLAVISGSF